MKAPVVPRSPGRRWTSRRALVAHAVILVWVPGCVLACWWQVTVALSGDELGWVYTFMWPVFALFSLVLWWSIIHDDPDTVGARGLERLRREQESAAPPAPRAGAPDPGQQTVVPDDAIARAEAEDAELAAYNAYLAELRQRDTKTRRR